jgi:ditrans,polycis-polyprenyl diphosphate synthase
MDPVGLAECSLTLCRAVLNVCFPYTSRDEITTAVMKTVETYSTPIHNLHTPSKRTFSESHITQHLRKQMLEEDVEAGAEQLESRSTSPASKDAKNPTEDEASSSASTAINPSDKEDSRGDVTFLDPETISAQTLTDNMMTADAPPLDLLIRTSGVERLSDFMLWQCHENTSIVFLKCLWPEFDLWQFLPVLVEWQWQQKKLHEEQLRIRGRSKMD